MSKSIDVVAIDGPSASGKSTVAKRVAAALGRVYADSGSLYRGITWHALRVRVEPSDRDQVVSLLSATDMAFFVESDAVCFRIGGVRPIAELRAVSVREQVSPMAAIPEVRGFVTERLRSLTRFGPLVMEGRDIGSVVFPAARYKFYLDASAEERARRRQADLNRQNERRAVGDVLASLKRRDTRDSSRPDAPLKVADGAEIIDSTNLSVDEVVARVVTTVRQDKRG